MTMPSANKRVTVSGTAANSLGVTQPVARTLTITDDEAASTTVTLTVSPASVAEDATGTRPDGDGDRDPERQRASDRRRRSRCRSRSGTAVEGTDFTQVSGFTVTIAPGADERDRDVRTLAPVDDRHLRAGRDGDRQAGTTTATGLSVAPAAGADGDDRGQRSRARR